MSEILTLPYSQEAEQAVLGGMMLDGGEERSQTVAAMLKPEAFFHKAHKLIYKAMRTLMARHQPIDLITLSSLMESDGSADMVGGFAYMAELAKNTPSAANLVHYARVVRDRAAERFAIAQLNKGIELLSTQSVLTAAEKLEAVTAMTNQIADHLKTGNRRGLREWGEVSEEWAAELDMRFSPDGARRGMTTGIGALDDALAPKGLVRGSLLVIGARPKMGKTTLYTQLALNCAIREEKPALMFSLEMPAVQILEKVVCQMSGVNPNAFYTPVDERNAGIYQGDLDGDLSKAFAMTAALSENGNLFIDDTPGMTLSQITSEARRIKKERGCVGMVLVDYLTLMTAEKAERNDLAYGLITKGLKNLAKELDCIVVLLTQLNRDLEKRVDKRPFPADSRDTGQIEQDCDYWIGVYREGVYDTKVSPELTELLLRLNRHGSTKTVHCRMVNGTICDITPDEYAVMYGEQQIQRANNDF